MKRKYWEYIIPILGTISLIATCAISSSKKPFWNDELLSFYLLSDPSFIHMMGAWGDTFNQAPPLYFMLGWLWSKFFGVADLSLRVFSSFSLCLAFTLVWITLRRTYRFWIASIAVLGIFCLSSLIQYHNVEVRMYGLFSAACALGLLQFDNSNREARCTWKSLSINTGVHSSIVLTHLYGVFYSGAILVAFLVRDKYFKIWRPKLYASIVAGWLMLALCVVPILNQADNSAKWFSKVSFLGFMDYFNPSSQFGFLILYLLVISALINLENSDVSKPLNRLENYSQKSEIGLIIFALAFMGVPILGWGISKTVTPMLNPRYIIPTIAVGWPIMLAYLTSYLLPISAFTSGKAYQTQNKSFWMSGVRLSMLWILSIFLLIYPVYYSNLRIKATPIPGQQDNNYGYLNLPFAMEAGHDFLPRFYYATDPDRYFHILDWETAIQNTDSAFATGDYTHLEALNRQYPFINSLQTEEFLDKHPEFLVLNEQDQEWFEARIQKNPNYHVQALGSVPDGAYGPLEVFYVKKIK